MTSQSHSQEMSLLGQRNRILVSTFRLPQRLARSEVEWAAPSTCCSLYLLQGSWKPLQTQQGKKHHTWAAPAAWRPWPALHTCGQYFTFFYFIVLVVHSSISTVPCVSLTLFMSVFPHWPLWLSCKLTEGRPCICHGSELHLASAYKPAWSTVSAQ